MVVGSAELGLQEEFSMVSVRWSQDFSRLGKVNFLFYPLHPLSLTPIRAVEIILVECSKKPTVSSFFFFFRISLLWGKGLRVEQYQLAPLWSG